MCAAAAAAVPVSRFAQTFLISIWTMLRGLWAGVFCLFAVPNYRQGEEGHGAKPLLYIYIVTSIISVLVPSSKRAQPCNYA